MTPIRLAAGDALAEIALLGAEPLRWRVGGTDLLWSGDPAHWNRRAPILFPVIGACTGGAVRVEGRAYPMPRHGFARDLPFALVEREQGRALLRLADSPETRVHYPFAFVLDVAVELRPDALVQTFTVTNPGPADLPYSLGVHPAFPWPLDGGDPDDHRVVFEADEDPAVPDLTPDGLLREGPRRLPLQGRVLPLSPDLFARDALVMRDLRGRSLRLEGPGGAVTLAGEGFSHAALWTKPGAPFLSLEAWTGYADPEGFSGDLRDKPSTRLLPPGERAVHRATMQFERA